MDNSVDEFIMGAGRQIDITVADNTVTVRDYGRGIPLKSLAAAVSEMNTGGKVSTAASGLQEDRGSERRGRQGREHALERIHRPFGARRRGPYGDLRQRGSSRATAGRAACRRRTALTSRSRR